MDVLGIDPGRTGFIVELNSSTLAARTLPIPFRPDGIVCYRTIKRHFDLKAIDLMILERVSMQPKFSASAAHTFGKCIGQLQMLLSAFPFAEVASPTWQKVMHLNYPDAWDAKAKSMAAFQRLNPNFKAGKKKVSKDLVDAFLIAAYGLKTSGVNINVNWVFHDLSATDK